jgi:RHS repeat-associated protein
LRVIWSIFILLLASLPSPVSGKLSSCFVPLSHNSSATGKIFIPPATETYTYDFDGNLLSDGRWTYAWDAENQLIAMQTLPGAPSGSARRLEFDYDDLGRRIKKRSFIGTTNILTSSTKFLYDGFNLLAELNETGNSFIRYYIWGSDITGAVRGTGGVGALVAVTDASQGTHFAVSDGQGNVVGLVKGTDGTRTATYEYDPFGQNIRQTGSASDLNPFRYSSRFTDTETDLIYYGFRLYNPNTGRWLNRDPISELGSLNLYAFVDNNPLENFDTLGLKVGDFWDPESEWCRLQGLAEGFWDQAKRLNQFFDDPYAALQAGVDAMVNLDETIKNAIEAAKEAYNRYMENKEGCGDPCEAMKTEGRVASNIITLGLGEAAQAGRLAEGGELLNEASLLAQESAQATKTGMKIRLNPRRGEGGWINRDIFGSRNKGFSTTEFGQAMHDRFRDALVEQTGTRPRDWRMNTARGQKGIDAIYVGGPKTDPGFKYAELKPNSPGTIPTFGNQLNNWNLPPGKTELWLYNNAGVIGSTGFRF